MWHWQWKSKENRYKLISSTWNELLHPQPAQKMSWGWHPGQSWQPCLILPAFFYILEKSFIIYLKRHTIYHLCMVLCLSSLWHYTGQKEEECCQAQRWNRWFLCEVVCSMAAWSSFWSTAWCAVSRFDKLDGDASADRSLLLWNCLTDGLHPVTVCYFAWKSALCSF